jgi:hypothetical protein
MSFGVQLFIYENIGDVWLAKSNKGGTYALKFEAETFTIQETRDQEGHIQKTQIPNRPVLNHEYKMALKASTRRNGNIQVGYTNVHDAFYWDCFFVLVMEELGKSLEDVKKTHDSSTQHRDQIDILTVANWALDAVSPSI